MAEATQTKLLLVDDESAYHAAFRRALRTWKDLQIETAPGGREALKKLEVYPADIVISDVRMPHMDGLALLHEIKARYPHTFVVMITGHADIQDAVKAMKLGAYDYLLKPFDMDAVAIILKKVIEHKNLFHDNIIADGDQRENRRFENIIGQDPKMFTIYEMISAVAKSDASVLLTGESGTGKELVAEAIHFRSNRKQNAFIRVNCAALTETLINSELFGHEKGAFSGATTSKKGYLEVADKGTLFLDEIGDIQPQTQISLLRVLELGSYQRVGSTSALQTDVRIICATNQDLVQAIQEKTFRADLFYRINVVSIHLPPLRERRLDVPHLAEYFLKKCKTSDDKNIKGFSNEAMRLLMKYDWPGNVRELANVIEHAAVFAKFSQIQPADLPEGLKSMASFPPVTLTLPSHSLAQAESILIRSVLEECEWNLKKAAKILEIARGTLYGKMNKYGISKPD